MNKQRTVIGFGGKQTGNSDVPVPDEPEGKKQDSKQSVEAMLVDLICERYQPANMIQESTDQKTTYDLIEEIESFCEVSKTRLVSVLKEKGFKPYYTGNQFVWLLRERTNA